MATGSTLEIRDNGAGLVDGRVRPDGIGLTTTKARLERLYGDRQELTLANLPEGGCVARIRIPFQLTGGGSRGHRPCESPRARDVRNATGGRR